jgi:heme peroxidase
MRGHSNRNVYCLVGEGFIAEPEITPAGHNSPQPSLASAAASPAPDPERAFKFGRMFKDLKMAVVSEEEKNNLRQNLIRLGQEMVKPSDTSEDSNIPSGYTYLGQFIAHEITFDVAAGEDFPQDVVSLDKIKQGRTPLLDLDSLYGKGPLNGQSPELYQDDKVSLRFNDTVIDDTYHPIFPNDLPRVGGEGADKLKAIIADPRNDENLAVAQVHVALIKFHNQVVAKLRAENQPEDTLFRVARDTVVRHFQWVVLDDYLPKIVNEAVLTSVLEDGPKCFHVKSQDELYMPVEFSAAAFRLGHSMVRPTYEWNRLRNSGVDFFLGATNLHINFSRGVASIFDLFEFGGFRGRMKKQAGLPNTWVIDWRRFFDFPDALEVKKLAAGEKVNKAKKIDTTLDLPLQLILNFQPEIVDVALRSIAVRNLLRGFYLQLPTAQAFIAQMLEAIKPQTMRVLSEDEIASGPHEALLRECQFHQRTPLWYYILKEAEILEEGNKLGPVGSRIVAETFYAIIRNSETSILQGEPKWRPSLGVRAPEKFDMVDLLKFARTISPIDKID